MSLSYRMGTFPVSWCNIASPYDFYCARRLGDCDGRLVCHEVEIRGALPE